MEKILEQLQASVPSIFVYIPYVFCINIPLFQLPITILHDLSVPLTTCFPVWDAAVMILLISDYRRGLMGIMRRGKVHGESTLQVTSASANSTIAISINE